MSMITDMLYEENDRLERSIIAYEKTIESLPKGTIVWKKIKKKAYPYLQWRDGSLVKSRYIKQKELNDMRESVDRRREYEHNIKGMKKSQIEIERMLGRSNRL